jgi:hypothetical protein
MSAATATAVPAFGLALIGLVILLTVSFFALLFLLARAGQPTAEHRTLDEFGDEGGDAR